MAQGWIVAAQADAAAARDIGFGFDLDVLDPAIGPEEANAKLEAAENVGVILSAAAAEDVGFVALLHLISQRLARAQLIEVEPEARALFAFLPESWPAMSLADAQTRAHNLAQQREQMQPPQEQQQEPAHATPLPPQAPEPEAPAEPEPTLADDAAPSEPAPTHTAEAPDEPPPSVEHIEPAAGEPEGSAPVEDLAAKEEEPAPIRERRDEESPPPAAESAEEFGATEADHPAESIPAEPPPPSASVPEAPPAPAAEPPPIAPSAPQPIPAEPPPPGVRAPPVLRMEDPLRTERTQVNQSIGSAAGSDMSGSYAAGRAGLTAPADATAFAPKKLRRETPELVRVAIHQPKDLKEVIKAARKSDPRTEPAPQSMGIGEVAIGASIGVALDVRGAACDGTLQRQKWQGEPLSFNFIVEAEDGVKQAVLIARVFIDDAQIGMIAFTRGISGPKKKPASVGDAARMKRVKRVFLSYSSNDREVVSSIATAYEAAGVPHFWDRTGLKSGEEWSPRLRREIDKADLFHLCWSRSAAQSEWVGKEAEHALTRRKRSNGKKPQITVQMLDGPPWAPHPPELDTINFDDFVRAAIVGYARGEG